MDKSEIDERRKEKGRIERDVWVEEEERGDRTLTPFDPW